MIMIFNIDHHDHQSLCCNELKERTWVAFRSLSIFRRCFSSSFFLRLSLRIYVIFIFILLLHNVNFANYFFPRN